MMMVLYDISKCVFMKYKVSWMSEKAILKSGRRVVGVFKNVEKCGKMGKNSCPRIRNTILLQ